MVKKLNVLSTFDGYSSGRLILKELNIPIKNYFSSEICPKAIKVSKDNFDDVIQIGSITEIVSKDLPQIDLLIGGSSVKIFQ